MGVSELNSDSGPRNSRGVLLARDRIRILLDSLLGAEVASERANNIAQVLMFTSGRRPEPIVEDMLREMIADCENIFETPEQRQVFE